MEIVDFNKKLAEKKGEVSPEQLISNLLQAINDGKVEEVVYVAKNKEGIIDTGFSTMNQTKTLGLLEIGKQIIINSMYEE